MTTKEKRTILNEVVAWYRTTEDTYRAFMWLTLFHQPINPNNLKPYVDKLKELVEGSSERLDPEASRQILRFLSTLKSDSDFTKWTLALSEVEDELKKERYADQE